MRPSGPQTPNAADTSRLAMPSRAWARVVARRSDGSDTDRRTEHAATGIQVNPRPVVTPLILGPAPHDTRCQASAASESGLGLPASSCPGAAGSPGSRPAPARGLSRASLPSPPSRCQRSPTTQFLQRARTDPQIPGYLCDRLAGLPDRTLPLKSWSNFLRISAIACLPQGDMSTLRGEMHPEPSSRRGTQDDLVVVIGEEGDEGQCFGDHTHLVAVCGQQRGGVVAAGGVHGEGTVRR